VLVSYRSQVNKMDPFIPCKNSIKFNYEIRLQYGDNFLDKLHE